MESNVVPLEQLKRAISGDTVATAHLLATQRERLLRRLETRLQFNPFADFSADDVLQEAYVDVFQGIGGFDPIRGVPFSAWINRVVDNRLAMFFRSRSRVKRGGGTKRIGAGNSSLIRLLNEFDDEDADTASAYWATEEARNALALCVAALPETQREAVQLYYIDGEKLEQIAETMKTSKQAVRGLIYRAKQSMREMMGHSSMWFSKR